jgi:hypothetical protein
MEGTVDRLLAEAKAEADLRNPELVHYLFDAVEEAIEYSVRRANPNVCEHGVLKLKYVGVKKAWHLLCRRLRLATVDQAIAISDTAERDLESQISKYRSRWKEMRREYRSHARCEDCSVCRYSGITKITKFAVRVRRVDNLWGSVRPKFEEVSHG